MKMLQHNLEVNNYLIFMQMSLCEVLEPLDYEEFLGQHQSVLERDPLKPILDFPPGDVELRVVKRKIRTEEPIIPYESM